MGWEQLPPAEVPTWRQEFNACTNCERLSAALKEIDELGENTGSQLSWKTIYEKAQKIAQTALK